MTTQDDLDKDVSQELKNAENSLRDLISFVMQEKYGNNWISKCKVSLEKIEKWHERKAEEKKRQMGGTIEERLIYYADFFNLSEIIDKNWDDIFHKILKNKNKIIEFLKCLESLRDPEAHNRELLPHQKHLIIGISGEIRTLIIRYRSSLETSDSYYPKIESARDNLGNIYTFGMGTIIDTKMHLRVGDQIEFVITASDPWGEEIEYKYWTTRGVDGIYWQNHNVFSIIIREGAIGKLFDIIFEIRSKKKFHALGEYDDRVDFRYEVLPPRE